MRLRVDNMNAISVKYLQTVMTNVASELHLKDWSFIEQTFENAAQNYFGVLIPINLIGKIGENDINFSIVLKLAPTDDRFRVSGAITLMFAREIFVYSELLPKYRDLQNSLPLPSQHIMPECYYVCKKYCNEVICMENMCSKGYEPFVNDMFLDLNHTIIAIKSLAKLHSLSFVLKETNLEFFEEAKSICVPLTEESNKRYLEILIDRLKKALNKFRNTCYVPLLEELERNCINLIESTAFSVKTVCLCHGDIWKENIMFQYQDGLPRSACIIDYQTIRICSPAFDILYLLVSSTTTALRKDHFNELLDIYYRTLEQSLSMFSLELKKIYTIDRFKYDLKIVAPACLIVANTAIWLSCGLQQEGHVRSTKIIKTEEEMKNAENLYTQIMKSIIDDLRKYELLT